MKKRIAAVITFVAAVGVGSTAWATDDPDQAQFPQISVQPTDQAVPVGGSTVLSVQATNADGYQWYRNGVVMAGQTNSGLVLENIGTNDVGFYTCAVLKGGELVPTRAVNLNVYTIMAAGDPITLYGSPVVSGGSSGSCPGPYAGYVNYTKTISQGWGWAPSSGTTIHTASDGTTRTDTKIVYLGKYLDIGCSQTSVTVPDPAPSPKYRFTIYFPSDVPANPYPIVLSGFDP
jgi:hypothetical protein